MRPLIEVYRFSLSCNPFMNARGSFKFKIIVGGILFKRIIIGVGLNIGMSFQSKNVFKSILGLLSTMVPLIQNV